MSTGYSVVPKGTILFRPGDDCGGFVIVHGGTIKVTLMAENGREIVLYRVRPGEICLQTFGCLTGHHPYSSEGIAETDVTVEMLSEAQFQDRVAKDTDFRAAIFAAVSQRFSEMEQLIEDVALTGLQARLSRLLLRLSNDNGIVIATHDSLAAEIGSGRAAVSRSLGNLSRHGLIELQRGEIKIRNKSELEDLCADSV